MGNNTPNEAHIVQTATWVTLLGGGMLPAGDLDVAMSRAPCLVAADGGADTALAQGQMPQAVIGDMDSISEAALARIEPSRIHHISEQLSTDFDKALRGISAPGILALGVTGGRVDHELAAYHSLVTRPTRRCIILGANDIIFAAPPRIELTLDPGCRVSLFPLAEVTGHSTGLDWPIEGLNFGPGTKIGTSNRTETGQVGLRFAQPGMLVILPRTALDAVMNAFL